MKKLRLIPVILTIRRLFSQKTIGKLKELIWRDIDMDDKKDDIEFNAVDESSREENMKLRAAIRNHNQRIRQSLQDTSAGFKLVEDNVDIVADVMAYQVDQKKQTGGRSPEWYKEAQSVNLRNIAEQSLNICLESIGKEWSYTRLLIKAGQTFRAQKFYEILSSNRAGQRALKDLDERTQKHSLTPSNRREYALELAERKGFYFDEDWSDTKLAQVGSFMVESVLMATNIFDVIKLKVDHDSDNRPKSLALTKEVKDMMREHNQVIDDSSAMLAPMISPPHPWSKTSIGAYNDPMLCKLAPIVKNMGSEQKQAIKEALRDGSMDECVEALNTLQSVPLSINEYILEAVEWVLVDNQQDLVADYPITEETDVPERIDLSGMSGKEKHDYISERDEIKLQNRTSVAEYKILTSRIAEAKELVRLGNVFYLPHQFDNRGRIYYTGSFGHHSHDYMRAMVQFANKELLQGNEQFLALQLANSWGNSIDKGTLDERTQWAADNQEMVERCGRDYKATAAEWGQADSPFEFLAACREWYNYTQDPDNYETGIAIGLDATNSGIQHYAAASLNPEDGHKVNLTYSEKPQDLYTYCLLETQDMINKHIVDLEQSVQRTPANDNERKILDKEKRDLRAAEIINEVGLTRKTVKRNVMTWAYSSRKYGFAQQLRKDWIGKIERDIRHQKQKAMNDGNVELANSLKSPFDGHAWQVANYLADKNESSVKKNVKSAEQGMAFFQACARALADENKQVKFVTPLGFPMIQNYWKGKMSRPKIFMANRETLERKEDKCNLQVPTNDVDKNKAVNAISPNMIHAMDSTHLMMSVLKCKEYDITDLLVIHDCVYTTIGSARVMSHLVREAFVDLYKDYCIYEDLKEQTKLRLDSIDFDPQVPEKGSDGKLLDIKDVMKSEYFFS